MEQIERVPPGEKQQEQHLRHRTSPHVSRLTMPTVDLRRLDCTNVGRGPWKAAPDISSRAVLVKNSRSGFSYKVYYGTRTKRPEEDATVQATAMCATRPHLLERA